jgi:WD40 repeat protein
MATIGQDGSAKVWDLATNTVLLSIPTGFTNANSYGGSVAFTPDGTKLLFVTADNTVSVWDISSSLNTDSSAGKPLMKLSGTEGHLISAIVSPNGKFFASSSDDTTVTHWNAATGQVIFTLKGHQAPAESLVFSPDSSRLYGGSDGDGTAIAWDTATGEALFNFSGQANVLGVDSIAASPDGKHLATGEFDTTLRVWDAATGSPLLTLFGHSSQIVSVAFSPDGKRLASGSEDGTVRIWDALTGQELLTLAGHTSGVLSVAFSLDGNRLYSTGRDETVKIWDVSPSAGSDWLNLTGHTGRVFGVTYRPDGQRLATWSYDGTVKVWDTSNGKLLLTISVEDSMSGGNADYSPDGKRLVIVTGKRARTFDAESGAELLSLAPFDESVVAARFSSDGNQIAVGSYNGIIRIYDSMNGKVLIEFGNPVELQAIAISLDGKRVASAGSMGVDVWDVTTGSKLLTYSGHGDNVRVSGVAFSPDGKRIASAGNDSAIRVWDSQTGREIFVLTGHTGSAFAVAFSPDGRYLASSSVDRTIKLWKLPEVGQTVEAPLTLYGHTAAVYRVAFSPDGAYLATVGRNPVVRIYTLKINDLIAVAQKHLTRTLTANECQVFLHMEDCPPTSPST